MSAPGVTDVQAIIDMIGRNGEAWLAEVLASSLEILADTAISEDGGEDDANAYLALRDRMTILQADIEKLQANIKSRAEAARRGL